MKDEQRQIRKSAGQARLHFDEQEASMERRLRTDAKVAANQKLYLDGYRKGLLGIPLENFTDLVEENGVKVERKNHRNFKAGYANGVKEIENQLNNSRTR